MKRQPQPRLVAPSPASTQPRRELRRLDDHALEHVVGGNAAASPIMDDEIVPTHP